MNSPIVRWWSVFSVTLLTSLFLMINGGAKFILDSDVTYISWLIIASFVAGSIKVGLVAKTGPPDGFQGRKDSHMVKFFLNTCASLGLLGTIIGIMIAMKGNLSELDPSNANAIKATLSTVYSGVGAALVTTMLGVLAGLSLRMQWAMIAMGEEDIS